MNVWVALTLESHIHNPSAARWLSGLGAESSLCFCRITQISLLRLLTTQAVMGDEVITQAEAWQAYDRWLEDSRVVFLEEPPGLESAFRSHSQKKDRSPKDWADAYLVAFADLLGLTLVTFDRALQNKAKNVRLLAP